MQLYKRQRLKQNTPRIFKLKKNKYEITISNQEYIQYDDHMAKYIKFGIVSIR